MISSVSVKSLGESDAVVQHAPVDRCPGSGRRADQPNDTRMVEESFAQLVLSLKAQIDGAGTIVSAATDELLNHPTRGVGASLQLWRASVETLMEATFNPDRATSAFGRLDQILADAGHSHSRPPAVCSTRMQGTPPWLG